MKNLFVQSINKKRVILVSLISVLMIAVITAGVSLALLSKNTEKRANNFTFGNISIELTEDKWEELKPEDKILCPDKTLPKDPVITNTGKNDLYAYMEVKVPRAEVRTVDDNEVINPSEVQDLFVLGEINDRWKRIDTKQDDECSAYLYVYEIPLSSGEKTPPLFENVKFINILEGELDMDSNIEMPITAYAIQSDYCSGEWLEIFNKYIES